jgi:hypothetical protein
MAEELNQAPPVDTTDEPSIVTQDQFNTFQGDITRRFDDIIGRLGQVPSPVEQTQPSQPDHTETLKQIDAQLAALNEQIDTAQEERTPISTLLTQRDTLNAQKLDITTINPLRNTGLAAIASLSTEQGFNHSTVDKELLLKYRPEIDSYLARLPAENRMDPIVARSAYYMIIGLHKDEIDLVAKEATLRSQGKAGDDPPSPHSQRTDGTPEGTPTVEELLGPQAAKALAGKGQTAEQWAVSRGHTDWKAYVEMVEKQRAA